MSTGAIVGIIIAVIIVAAIVLLGPALLRQMRMRRQFGPEYDRLAKEVGARVREACRTMPDPPPLAIFDNVYAEPTAILRAEREQYAAYLDTFGGAGQTGEPR